MTFAREGFPFILGAALLAAAAFAVAVNRRSWGFWLVALFVLVLAVWVAYFFRDPERTGQRGPTLVISPADGKLVMVTEVDEPSFIGGRAIRLSIFMNVFNVHVNRYPVGGAVKYLFYNKGKFLNAASDKSSLENEQQSVGIETTHGRVLVRQIAGLIARRIVTYSLMNEVVHQGDRMGMIRFGSRVDVFLPTSAHVKSKPGDVMAGGITVLADLQ